MFSLPEDILIDIVGIWSHTNSIIKLDTACCNSVIRSNILDLFIHDGLSISWPHIRTENKNSLFLKWIQQRNIKLSTIFIFAPTNFATKNALLYPINLTKILTLSIGGNFDSETNMCFEDVINSCVNMTQLRLHSPSISDNLFTKIKRLSQLKIIGLSGNTSQLTAQILQILANKCRNLQNISLCFSTFDWIIIDDDDIKRCFLRNFRNNLTNLLTLNNKIKHINLNITGISLKYIFEEDEAFYIGLESWNLIEIISNTCPLIETCELIYSGSLNISHVANFFLNNKLLRHFLLNNSSVYHKIDRVVKYDHSSSAIKRIYCSNFYDTEYDYTGESHFKCMFASANLFTHIELHNITDLSDEMIILIANKNCKSLVHLSIEASGKYWSLLSIVAALTTCKILTSLELKDCSHLSNVDFEKLFATPNVLSKLTINNVVVL
jgi:hypothetical protein